MRRFLPLIALLTICTTIFAADIVTSRPIAPGITYTSISRPEGPWEIRVLRINRSSNTASIHQVLGQDHIRDREPVASLAERLDTPDNTVVAAVNGDFFTMSGTRRGLTSGPAVTNGELLTRGGNFLTFYIDADGNPGIGNVEVSGELATATAKLPVTSINWWQPKTGVCIYTSAWGWPVSDGILAQIDTPLATTGNWTLNITKLVAADEEVELKSGQILINPTADTREALAALRPGDVLKLSLSTPSLNRPLQTVMGGQPILVRDSVNLHTPSPKEAIHPRTAVGYNDAEIIFVTVDGRQPNWSAGMPYSTLAALMLELGCTEAINIDGGGSTTTWIRGEIVNRPSDGFPRPVANALLIRSSAPHGPFSVITCRPERITAVSGAAIPLKMWLTDAAFNPVDADPDGVTASVIGNPDISAQMTAGTITVSGAPGSATIRVSHPAHSDVYTDIPLTVVAQPDNLILTPHLARVCAGDMLAFQPSGQMSDGSSVYLPDADIRWRAKGEGVRKIGHGRYQAITPGAMPVVEMRLGKTRTQAPVHIAQELTAVGFETPAEAHATRYPDNDAIAASLDYIDQDAPQGTTFARLNLNLGEPVGTRGAYLRMDRNLGTVLKVSVLARAHTDNAAWVRATFVDGNNTPQTFTLSKALTPSQDWQRLELRLPTGIKAPVTWQSVYIVATAGKTIAGYVDFDDFRVATVPE